jgi:hypothetical protein
MRVLDATPVASPSGWGRPLGRWSCSPRRPGFGPPSCSRSNTVTLIAAPVSSRSDGRTRTDGLSEPRQAEQRRCSAAGDRARGARPTTRARNQPAALPKPARRFRNFNRRHWKPVQRGVGIEPLRDLYNLRHTYATFALRAVPVFALSRFMETSIAMIDLHDGHLAVDSHQHAVSLLDALALARAVDAGWTSARRPAKPQNDTVSRPRGRRPRRAVDARWTSRSEPVMASALRRG